MCPFQYYIVYTLGNKFDGNVASNKGNVVHKALEVLGNQKIAIQNGKDGYEDEIFGYLKNSETDWKWATEAAYDYYVGLEPHLRWNHKKDRADCIEWTERAMTINDGAFNPLNLDMIAVEKTFDITFEEDWAKYSYDFGDGKIVDGYLSIKGTIDMVYRENESVISVLDWKTGRCWDWGRDKPKSYKSLRYDDQLMIYFYALSQAYPEAEHILMNIAYFNTKGVFSLPYEKKDLMMAKEMIKKKFKTIKESQKPYLNKSWKCSKLCGAGKTMYKDTGLTYCDFFQREVKKNGVDKTFQLFGDKNKLSRYQDGGGRKATDD
jgi:ATP-dependent helicase/DNAse subunit B